MSRTEFNDGRGVLRLWGGWLLAIFAWILHLGVSYGIVGWYCQPDRDIPAQAIRTVLHGVTLLAAMLAISGIFLAWRNLRLARRSAKVRPRSRFMAFAGVLLSSLMLAIILVQGMPIMLVELCQ